MRLSTAIVAPRASPRRLLAARAPRGPRGRRSTRTPATSFARTIAPSSRGVSVSVSARSTSANKRLDDVIAVVAPSGHVQEQVDLRRRRQRPARRARSLAAQRVALAPRAHVTAASIDRPRCALRSARCPDSASRGATAAQDRVARVRVHDLPPSWRSTRRATRGVALDIRGAAGSRRALDPRKRGRPPGSATPSTARVSALPVRGTPPAPRSAARPGR